MGSESAREGVGMSVGGGVVGVPLGVHVARRSLGELLEVVERGGALRIAKRQQTAVLVPVSRLSEEVLAAAPVWTFTSARKDLGQLVVAAAGGVPQVIARGRHPVAAVGYPCS